MNIRSSSKHSHGRCALVQHLSHNIIQSSLLYTRAESIVKAKFIQSIRYLPKKLVDFLVGTGRCICCSSTTNVTLSNIERISRVMYILPSFDSSSLDHESGHSRTVFLDDAPPLLLVMSRRSYVHASHILYGHHHLSQS